MSDTVKVAISTDFFTSFARLPKAQQGKVSKFIVQFKNDPRSRAINYEHIAVARDPAMRSVRIDQSYRGIVLAPKEGNVYLLLWVDHHDEAYEWAARHRCNINPETGAVQIFEVSRGEGVGEEGSQEGRPAGVFEGLKDRELVRLGVPEVMIAEVRAVSGEQELDAIESRLPVEAYEGLFLYLAGAAYEDILREREGTPEKVDTEDFASALERVESQSRFVVVENETELVKMLAAPLEKWRVFLHPSQRKLVEGKKHGAFRVLGGAGTGKTVVAMHRAKWLAEHALGEHGRVLFTTFTRNLATDIESNLKTICPPEIMERIEVVSIDRWVWNFLRRHDYEYQVLYGFEDTDSFWEKALDLKPLSPDLPDSFYREEWTRVIQP